MRRRNSLGAVSRECSRGTALRRPDRRRHAVGTRPFGDRTRPPGRSCCPPFSSPASAIEPRARSRTNDARCSRRRLSLPGQSARTRFICCFSRTCPCCSSWTVRRPVSSPRSPSGCSRSRCCGSPPPVVPERRWEVWLCVPIATLFEVFGSLIWGGYTYELHNIPLYVPPGTRSSMSSGSPPRACRSCGGTVGLSGGS